MAQCSDEEDPNDVVSSLPTLPFDLMPEILCRLPVKLLFQLRCLCKFFNSLISDPKFAKKHLQLSTKCHRLIIPSDVMYDSPIPSNFSTSTVFTLTQLYPPNSITTIRPNYAFLTHSCDGICFGVLGYSGFYFLWNPSIRKFKLLPPLENPLERAPFSISFGYDCFIDKYKVIVVSYKNEVCVYTLGGTDYWTRMEDIPSYYNIRHGGFFGGLFGSGIFVSGAVNWFATDESDSSLYCILSLDLEKESYQTLLLPYYENENYWWKLDVVRDCLCVFATNEMFLDVWIMKEYGNEESWTKLFRVPKMEDHGFRVLYISEDDQLLLECYNEIESSEPELVVYDSKTGTLINLEFRNNYEYAHPKVYIESLISP